MHPEQIEAIAQQTVERVLGNTQVLEELHLILKKTNVSTLRPGESDAIPLNAGLFHSLFLSHVRLAQMMSDFISAHQQLQDRVSLLEQSIPAIQEAVINLQMRMKAFENNA